jgi:hypothetical protein
MADALGDSETAELYRWIYTRGRAWVDQNLFNGAYFTQQVDIRDKSVLTPFIKGEKSLGVLGDTVEQLYWSEEHGELKYQLGGGCLIDQALGQWHATLYGLGDLFDPGKVAASLGTIYANNFKPRLGDIYNPCRVFGLDDEAGTVIATWPEGAEKPAVPVPYAQETMHGMEYALAQLLVAYGMTDKGITVTAGVRDRYDGARRNPWNEIECGSNYARSMASWGAMVIFSGFSFDATRGHIGFAPRIHRQGIFRSFWSGANAYGTVELGEGRGRLGLLGGDLHLADLGLPLGSAAATVTLNGSPVEATVRPDGVALPALDLVAGDVLEVSAPTLSLRALPDLATL